MLCVYAAMTEKPTRGGTHSWSEFRTLHLWNWDRNKNSNPKWTESGKWIDLNCWMFHKVSPTPKLYCGLHHIGLSSQHIVHMHIKPQGFFLGFTKLKKVFCSAVAYPWVSWPSEVRKCSKCCCVVHSWLQFSVVLDSISLVMCPL